MGTLINQMPNMRLIPSIFTKLLLISIFYYTLASTETNIFNKKKEANEILKSKSTGIDNKLTQDEWNNELLFNLHLTTYERWNEFTKPWKRYKIGKSLIKCKNKCMKADRDGWGFGGRRYKYDETYELWKSNGHSVEQKPDFPCADCLKHFKVIRPQWKRIIKDLDGWVGKDHVYED